MSSSSNNVSGASTSIYGRMDVAFNLKAEDSDIAEELDDKKVLLDKIRQEAAKRVLNQISTSEATKKDLTNKVNVPEFIVHQCEQLDALQKQLGEAKKRNIDLQVPENELKQQLDEKNNDKKRLQARIDQFHQTLRRKSASEHSAEQFIYQCGRNAVNNLTRGDKKVTK